MRRLSSLLMLCSLLPASIAFADIQDPTRPFDLLGVDTAVSTQPWNLEAIIISPGKQYAVINQKTIMVGDYVAGFKVVSIKSNIVHLEGRDSRMTLFLFNESIKKPKG